MSSAMRLGSGRSAKNAFPFRLFVAVLAVSVLAVAVVGWQLSRLDDRFDALTRRNFQLSEYVGRIMLFDEVLTMSARMAAATGDPGYQKRYDEFDAKLDALLKETQGVLREPEIRQFVGQTDEANRKLVEIERRALALTSAGRRTEASALLTGDEYLSWKAVYADGVGKIEAWQNAAVERDARQFDSPRIAFEIAIGMVAVVLLWSWYSTFRRGLRWSRERLEVEAALRKAGDELEQRVRERTAELRFTNETLHGHDSLLKAVAHSAADLLGAIKFEDALMSVMELIGLALRVSRIQYTPATIGHDGHLRARVTHEWVAPGLSSMLGEPLLQDFDISTQFPMTVAASLIGEPIMLVVDEMPVSFRRVLGKEGIKSLLIMPVMSENRLCGYLVFLDASEAQREWTWAETDTMKTLADLVGVAISRARTVKELADANTIVQNSPTILYRLKGEPALPLTYVSHNIAKFGYDPKKLVASEKLWQTLVYIDDQPKVRAAMAAIMEKDFSSATLEFRLVVPAGTYRWVENRYTAVRDEAGRLVEIEGIIIDVTERKAAEEKIALLARTDSLTGLANRTTFIERLHQSFASSKRGESPFAVLYLDLDRFKDINDTRGHPAGDLVLREVAERLKNAVRKNDVVARLGGDEFAVLQTDIADPADAGALAGKIRDSLAMPYKIGGNELHITASIGISPFSPDTSEPDAMLAQADLALYRAKEEGRNQYRFHSEDLDRQVSERVALAEELRSAIEHSEIEVYYQPQVELSSGNIVGMEALVRWNHPTRGVLAPAAFIAVAERTGTMRALGQRVLENACRQMKLWREQGIGPPVIAVNVSILQLKAGTEFIRDVTGTLAKAGLVPSDLELDVTESMLARTTLSQNDVLDRLQQLGVRIALDNFGTEYSSFDYLRTYRVNHLKVARQFIEKATEDPKQAATIRAIIGAARELGIQVIAQGVETKEQRALLISIGSPTAQGFYFSEPVRAQRATELLTRGAIERPSDQSAAAE